MLVWVQSGHMTCNIWLWPTFELDWKLQSPSPISWLGILSFCTNMIKFQLYSLNCSYVKQTLKPFYFIGAKKWWVNINHV